MMVWITLGTDAVDYGASVHAWNVTVFPFYSTNPNIAPYIGNLKEKPLRNEVTVFIDHNYNSTPYVLPEIIDFDGNVVYLEVS